jgi:hypothetical protein
MRALSIRQPYAELILRGVKRVEFRSRPTSIVGERFWIYASQSHGSPVKVWSDDLAVEHPPAWMLDVASQIKLLDPDDLPRGLLVGSAVIDKVTPYDPDDGLGYDGLWRWHLREVRRIERPVKPRGHPQPVWWLPRVEV